MDQCTQWRTETLTSFLLGYSPGITDDYGSSCSRSITSAKATFSRTLEMVIRTRSPGSVSGTMTTYPRSTRAIPSPCSPVSSISTSRVSPSSTGGPGGPRSCFAPLAGISVEPGGVITTAIRYVPPASILPSRSSRSGISMTYDPSRCSTCAENTLRRWSETFIR